PVPPAPVRSPPQKSTGAVQTPARAARAGFSIRSWLVQPPLPRALLELLRLAFPFGPEFRQPHPRAVAAERIPPGCGAHVFVEQLRLLPGGRRERIARRGRGRDLHHDETEFRRPPRLPVHHVDMHAGDRTSLAIGGLTHAERKPGNL